MKKTVRGVLLIPLLAALLLLIGTHAQSADAEGFDSQKIIAELEKQIELSKDQWEKLKPVLEMKSSDLQKGLNESIDKGFAELEKLAKQFESMTKDAEKKIGEIVSSEEAQKLLEYLSKIDREAIDDATKKMVEDLTALLELTEEQSKKIKPVLEECFSELSAMIQGLAKEGSRNWNEFMKDFEKLTQDLYNKVRQTLDEKQMEKLEQYNDGQKKEIERILFRV